MRSAVTLLTVRAVIAAAAARPWATEPFAPRLRAEQGGIVVAAEGANPVVAGCMRRPAVRLNGVLVARLRGAAQRRPTLRISVGVEGGSTRLAACLPRPESLPGRSAVRRLVVRLERGLSPTPAGRSIWRALFTPVGASRGATTESRAVVVSPSFLTLELARASVRVRRGSRFTVRGSLSMVGLQAHRWIRILSGRNARSLQFVGRVRPTGRGMFAFSTRAPRRTGTLLLQARARSRVARGECRSTRLDAPAGCKHATVGGVSSSILSTRVR